MSQPRPVQVLVCAVVIGTGAFFLGQSVRGDATDAKASTDPDRIASTAPPLPIGQWVRVQVTREGQTQEHIENGRLRSLDAEWLVIETSDDMLWLKREQVDSFQYRKPRPTTDQGHDTAHDTAHDHAEATADGHGH